MAHVIIYSTCYNSFHRTWIERREERNRERRGKETRVEMRKGNGSEEKSLTARERPELLLRHRAKPIPLFKCEMEATWVLKRGANVFKMAPGALHYSRGGIEESLIYHTVLPGSREKQYVPIISILFHFFIFLSLFFSLSIGLSLHM